MSDDDVVVIGGGLAGSLAALTTARERPDAAVRLLCPRPDRYDYHSGTINLLGYDPRRSGVDDDPAALPFEVMSSFPSSHPYRRVGEDGVRAALDAFVESLGDVYRGADTNRNALFVSPNGRLGPAHLYPSAMAAGKATVDEPTLLVGFEQVPDFDAALASERLADRVRCQVDPATIDLPFGCTAYPAHGYIADRFAEVGPDGRPTPGRDRETTPEWETFVDRLAAELDVQARVGIPAVLGRCDNPPLRRALESRLTARVFEIPTGPPSIPGRRLQTRLLSAATAAGVAVVTDCEPKGFAAADGRIQSLTAGGSRYEGAEFVLATGGVASGGLVGDRSTVVEPVFDCHVEGAADRSEWFADEFLGDHPYARDGLAVDDDFRPLDADGDPVFENLSAVGRLLGGVDYAGERSGDGVAIATGYAVGRRLAESR